MELTYMVKHVEAAGNGKLSGTTHVTKNKITSSPAKLRNQLEVTIPETTIICNHKNETGFSVIVEIVISGHCKVSNNKATQLPIRIEENGLTVDLTVNIFHNEKITVFMKAEKKKNAAS
jgi:hypothetical protein